MNTLELIQKSPYSYTLEECEFMLNHYNSMENKYDYEMKIRAIERTINKLNKPIEKQQWEYDAEEYIALTEKWERLGAHWENYNDWKTQWMYNGICFYEIMKGSHVSDMIIVARKADLYLMELVDTTK